MQLIKQLRTSVPRVAHFLALAAVAFIGMTNTALAGRPLSYPEIDPSAIGAAVTLFVGGAMYLTSRRHAE